MGFGNAFYFVAFFLFGSLFATDIVTAQTIAYRQANLAANLPNVANSPGASGDHPQEATRVVDNSSTGAVYKGVAILIALALFGFTTRTAGKFRTARFPLVTATAAAAIVALGLAIAGCGGYGSGAQANRGTASIIVIAQSGNISRMTTIRVTVQ